MIGVRKSVKAKLSLGFGLVLVLVCLLGAFSVLTLERAGEVSGRMYTTNIQGLGSIERMTTLLSGMQINIADSLMFPQKSTSRRLVQELSMKQRRIEQTWEQYYPEQISSSDERQAAEKASAAYAAFFSKLDDFAATEPSKNYLAASNFYGKKLQSSFDGIRSQLHLLSLTQTASAAQAYVDAKAASTLNRQIIIGAVVAVLLLTLVITFLLVRMISRPLTRAGELVAAIAEGRLDHEVDNPFKDEFGVMLGALKDMQRRLADIVAKVRQNCESVGVGASQIASGNDELSSRTQEHAANLEETAASMEQMASTVKQNADNAAQADQLTQGVRSQASEGGEVIGRAVKAMGEIDAASGKIADIIGMIDDIAFQTNLLALNASVEAARAGEQGRGFAVVAAEVRNLASRSAESAKEIKELVNDSAAKVEDGSQLVKLSGKTLEEIVESINKVSDIGSEIAAASSEQSSGIDQVNLAVSQMDSMTQQNAALVEQSAAASRSLEEQADALKHQVAFFKLPAGAEGAEGAGVFLPQLATTETVGEQPAAEPDGTSRSGVIGGALDQADASRPPVAARSAAQQSAWGTARKAAIDEEEEWVAF